MLSSKTSTEYDKKVWIRRALKHILENVSKMKHQSIPISFHYNQYLNKSLSFVVLDITVQI